MKTAILGFGIDLCDPTRIMKLIESHSPETLEYLYDPEEFAACMSSTESSYAFASIFALKEAFGKSVGNGMAEMSWRDIFVTFTSDWVFTISVKEKARRLVESVKARVISCNVEKKKMDLILATVILEGTVCE